MFGVELWFIYALLSAVSGGFYVFTTKIAAERNYDGVVVHTAGSLVSAIILVVATLLVSEFQACSWLAIAFAAVNGILYMWGSVLRFEALKCIDTAIFYPLYKTLLPLLALGLGVFVLGEIFNQREWFGLALSFLVPLLLLSRNEKYRQRDLGKGLKILLIVSVFASVAAYALKVAVGLMSDVLLLTAIVHSILVLVGIIMALQKKSLSELIGQSKQPRDASYIPDFIDGFVSSRFFFGFYGCAPARYTCPCVYYPIAVHPHPNYPLHNLLQRTLECTKSHRHHGIHCGAGVA